MNDALPAAPSTPAASGDGYGDDYLTWKNWQASDFGQVSRYQRHYFPREMARCQRPLPAGSRVLELGFGNGAFMAWGRAQGWHMHGTEVNPPLVEAARAAGFEAVCADSLEPWPDAWFDLVVAFDVLEHIPQAALPGVLRSIQRVLKPGGAFLARFPNADSPFGLANQHGDLTHVTAIGRGKVVYLANRLGAELTYVGAEAEPLWVGLSLTSVQHILSAPLKALAAWAVRLVFLPHAKTAFFSPNLVMVLRWNPAAGGQGPGGR
ncbi:MAG: class I SAM-dependent methyltransferase [Comamonadaceae bacterium]|nr:MAG: class I SAM-dependent methyltransferase [Comamonadaceae bacterium]